MVITDVGISSTCSECYAVTANNGHPSFRCCVLISLVVSRLGYKRAVCRHFRVSARKGARAVARRVTASRRSSLGNDGRDCPCRRSDETFAAEAHNGSSCCSWVDIDESGVQSCLEWVVSNALPFHSVSRQGSRFPSYKFLNIMYGLLLLLSLLLAITNVLLLRTVSDYSFRRCNLCPCIYIYIYIYLFIYVSHSGVLSRLWQPEGNRLPEFDWGDLAAFERCVLQTSKINS